MPGDTMHSAPAASEGRLSAQELDSVEAVAALHSGHYSQASRLQRAIDALTRGLGRPAALVALVALLSVWATLAALGGGSRDSLFGGLELAAAVAALLIAVLILVTQRRENELADRRAQLTLELALLADRRSAKIIALIEELRRDNPELSNRIDQESDAMATPTDPNAVVAAIDDQCPSQ